MEKAIYATLGRDGFTMLKTTSEKIFLTINKKTTKIALVAASVGVILILTLASVMADTPTVTQFIAVLDTGQESNPAINNPEAHGVAFLTLTEHEGTATLQFSISFFDLGSDTVAAHFHGPSKGFTNVGVQVALSGFLPDGDETGLMTGSVPLSSAQVQMAKNGELYINIHTEEFGGGEIRGQVLPIARPGLFGS